MVWLTKLNGDKILVNADLIEFVETAPDTIITLQSGKKILVRESPDDIVSRIIEYRAKVLKEKEDLFNHD